MPDLSGLPALDVAIGLAFIYFVLSIVCSAVNEGIAATFRLRARDLERGIRSLLSDEPEKDDATKGAEDDATVPAEADRTPLFYKDPRIRALQQPIWMPRIDDRKPSYIPARTFALAVVDTLKPPTVTASNKDLLSRASEAMEELPNGPLKSMLSDALAEARGTVAGFMSSMERSFDEVMDRVSGWYKRRVQWILLVIALVIVGAANVDSFDIGERLFRDDAVRAAVVARAGDQTSPVSCTAEDTTPTTLDEVADCVDEIDSLGLPLGWSDANAPNSVDGWAFKVIGLLITAFALTLGAPFWFDTLGKLAHLRGTGNREGTQKTERAPTDRDERPPS